MRLSFKYPCRVGVVLPDGSMTSMTFGMGERTQVVINTGCITLEARTHRDFELADGTLLINVPLNAIWLEPEYANRV